MNSNITAVAAAVQKRMSQDLPRWHPDGTEEKEIPGSYAEETKADLVIGRENRCGEGTWEQLALEMGEAVRRRCSAISALNPVVTWGSAQGVC